MDQQFHRHMALPEDLAHEIFESCHRVIWEKADGSHEEVFKIADNLSKAIQQHVADHYSDLIWKLINRRKS